METNSSFEDWGEGLFLDGGVAIYPQRALPHLNVPGGAAYMARHKSDASQEMMGIICSRAMWPRTDAVGAMKMANASSLLRLRASGVVHWPAQRGRFYALVYEMPMASRYWNTLEDTRPTMSEDILGHAFIKPMVDALLELHRIGLCHGAIRPTNIFWQGGSTTPPQLGDSLSAPCGVGQPVAFEPVERALCEPVARGAGTHADDCYALGVTLAMAMLGSNPFRGMDDRAVLRLKMEKGSFGAVIGSKRLAPSHIEILRGLLTDEPSQRWSAEDLEQWMAGRRLTSKSTDAGRRSSRHFSVNGKEYWQLRPLAAALAENVGEAVKLIESGSLEKWIRRSLGDEERAKNIVEIIDTLKTSNQSGHYQEQLVARVCIALDPSSPIRYRGMAVMPLGIASALVDAAITGKSHQALAEIITSQLVTLWVNMQKDSKLDMVPFAQQMERMKSIAERTALGSGIERVLYELNAGTPCFSPLFKNDYVLSARDVLPALERVAESGAHAGEPIDRHLAAFLIARDRRSEGLFAAMTPGEPVIKRGLAMLSLFGELQYRYGPDQLPHLCRWLFPYVEPGLKRFLSKPLQEKLRALAKEAADRGSLSLLLKRVDDPARVVGDENDFFAARQMYASVQQEMAVLEGNLKNKEIVARETGRPIAASIASLLALILIAMTLWRAMWNGLMGG